MTKSKIMRCSILEKKSLRKNSKQGKLRMISSFSSERYHLFSLLNNQRQKHTDTSRRFIIECFLG